MKKARWFVLALLLAGLGVLLCRRPLVRAVFGALQAVKGKHTTAERLEQYGAAVRARLATDFLRVDVNYPPRRVLLLGLKDEKRLEVWVRGAAEEWRRLRTYPIRAASGRIGPKLREGDRQVPEGFYRVASLNPNSRFHLALRVDYPNAEDLARAEVEGRTGVGGDIMIHGSDVSVGCLAMGDEAAEDLFVLAADAGIENVSVILSPVDFRVRDLPRDLPVLPEWAGELYGRLKKALEPLAP